MISLVVLAAIVVLLAILLLSNTAGTSASINNIVPDNEGSDSIGEANISSASATITITMYALPEDGWS